MFLLVLVLLFVLLLVATLSAQAGPARSPSCDHQAPAPTRTAVAGAALVPVHELRADADAVLQGRHLGLQAADLSQNLVLGPAGVQDQA